VRIDRPAGVKWVNEIGMADMRAIALGKKKPPGFDVGFYHLKSLGELDRCIGGFPDNPVQSLTDWTVTLDSACSLNAGMLSTIDLLYWLEWMNEEYGTGEFSLMGCEAALCRTDGSQTKEVFRCSVAAVSSGGGTTSITFSERIGSPSIAKSPLPVILGWNPGFFYWPVEAVEDSLGVKELWLGEASQGELFIYSEKLKEYLPVAFNPKDASFASGRTKIIFGGPGTSSDYRTLNPVSPADSCIEVYRVAIAAMNQAQGREPWAVLEEPMNCIVGGGDSRESAQAWTMQSYITPESETGANYMFLPVRLRRAADWRMRKHQPKGANAWLAGKPAMMTLRLESYPESIVDAGAYSDSNVAISGDPNLFLSERTPDVIDITSDDVRAEFKGLGLEAYFETHWKAYYQSLGVTDSAVIAYAVSYSIAAYKRQYGSQTGQAAFKFKFPDVDLPSGSIVTSLCLRVSCNFICHKDDVIEGYLSRKGQVSEFRLHFGDIYDLSKESLSSWTMPGFLVQGSQAWSPRYFKAPFPFSEAQDFGIAIVARIVSGHWGSARLFGVKRECDIEIPYSGGLKLFTRGRKNPSPGVVAGQTSGVLAAIASLLAAANVSGYGASEGAGGVGQTQVATALANESADLREKLKTLAIASSTLIKSDPLGACLIASSMERKREDAEMINIPVECLLLQDNMYSFSMQTPMEDQICSGLEISYGKDMATGKYVHRLLVAEDHVEHDGQIFYTPLTADLRDAWEKIFSQLGKNIARGRVNLKAIESEWIVDRDGAERMAATYLSWHCAPLRRAQVKCVRNEHFPDRIDIGEFAMLDLPGYPAKMAGTAWMVTAITDDLDKSIATIALAEAWGIKAPRAARYILLESGGFIDTENGRKHLMLEERKWQT